MARKQNNSSIDPKAFLSQNPLLVFVIAVALASALIAVVSLHVWRGGEEYTLSPEDKALMELLHAEAVPASAPTATTTGASELQENFDTSDNPLNGTVIFSGRKLNSTSSVQLFGLDVADASSTPTVFPALAKVSSLAEFMDVSDPNSGFFTSAVSPYSLMLEADDFGIHLVDPVEETLTYITSASSTRERNLAWSESAQLLAYSRLQTRYEKSFDTIQTKNWEIAIVDPVNDALVQVITEAVQPVWSPDGTKLVYLKNDGLYVYQLDTQQETKVLGAAEGGQFLATSMINVSPDGKYLIWTTPGLGLIVMNEIVSWDSFALKELGRIEDADTQFYWPQFSPDGAYYVVQAIDDPIDGRPGRSNERLEIRPTLGKNIVYSYLLNEFDFNSFFTDSWIVTE